MNSSKNYIFIYANTSMSHNKCNVTSSVALQAWSRPE